MLEQALLGDGTVVLEKTVSAPDERRFDLHFIPGSERRPPAESELYMQLLRRMTQAECLIEVFATTPSIETLRSCTAKHLDHHQNNRRAAKKHKVPRPSLVRLWIISPGRPEAAMRRFRLRPVLGWPTGTYRSSSALRMWLVVLSELPLGRETLLLRLLGSARIRLGAAQEIQRLPSTDPIRRPLLRALAHVKFVLDRDPTAGTAQEREEMSNLLAEFERYEADVFRRGVEQGEARGKAASILAILAARGLAITEEARSRIQGCDDLAQLDAWLAKVLTAATVDGLFHAN